MTWSAFISSTCTTEVRDDSDSISQRGREIVRDGRLRLLGGLVLILAVVAMLFGAQQTQRAQEARENAQRTCSEAVGVPGG